MTRHEVQALVIAAVGDLPWVTRIDYVVDAWGMGVIVSVGTQYIPLLHTALEEATCEAVRAYVEQAYTNTRRRVLGPATGEGLTL